MGDRNIVFVYHDIRFLDSPSPHSGLLEMTFPVLIMRYRLDSRLPWWPITDLFFAPALLDIVHLAP
jgi:hypothetical protein